MSLGVKQPLKPPWGQRGGELGSAFYEGAERRCGNRHAAAQIPQLCKSSHLG